MEQLCAWHLVILYASTNSNLQAACNPPSNNYWTEIGLHIIQMIITIRFTSSPIPFCNCGCKSRNVTHRVSTNFSHWPFTRNERKDPMDSFTSSYRRMLGTQRLKESHHFINLYYKNIDYYLITVHITAFSFLVSRFSSLVSRLSFLVYHFSLFFVYLRPIFNMQKYDTSRISRRP